MEFGLFTVPCSTWKVSAGCLEIHGRGKKRMELRSGLFMYDVVIPKEGHVKMRGRGYINLESSSFFFSSTTNIKLTHPNQNQTNKTNIKMETIKVCSFYILNSLVASEYRLCRCY